MKFPILVWAIAQNGPQYKFALSLGENESWLSRRLTGRAEFTAEDRDRVAGALGYPAEWLFQTPTPPAQEAPAEILEARAYRNGAPVDLTGDLPTDVVLRYDPARMMPQ